MNDENKRIARNTIILYIRMIINIAIGIFTGRVVLDALGESDYGVYTVVAGFIGLFSFVSTPIAGAISRFVVYNLGKGDIEKTRDVFGTSIIVMNALNVLIFVLAETIGVWFINTKLVIPHESIIAANWVFQFSIIDTMMTMAMSPYFASFISHERFDIDAILALSISFVKLGICFVIMYAPSNRLIIYAGLLLLTTIIQRMIYKRYARKHFEECTYKLKFDKPLFKEIFSFASWGFVGNMAGVIQKQGVNILVNLFGGVFVNAAVGVAGTINGIILGFVGNFTTTFSPQITKSYASEKHDRTNTLIFHGTKLSFYMILIFAIPVFLNIDWVLNIWLVKVPEYSATFVRIGLLSMMCSFLAQQISIAKTATGNIKYYQIVTGIITVIALPISYLCLKSGASVMAIFYVNLIIDALLVIVKAFLLKGEIINFSVRKFIYKVVLNSFAITIISAIIPTLIWLNMDDGFLRVLTTCLVSVIITFFVIYFIGCDNTERKFLKAGLVSIKNKIHKH